MPTTARLVGAVLLAILGAVAANQSKVYLPDGTPPGMLVPFSAAVGAVLGWVFTGRHLDRGRGSAIAVGLGSAALLTFWVMFLFAGVEMVNRATRLSYGGSPTAALQDVFAIMMDYGRDMLQFDVALILILGGIIVGGITAWVGRRYR